MNICLLVGKKSPQILAGRWDKGAEDRGNCMAHCKASQPRFFESPVAHSVLEMLHQLLHPYFSTGWIQDPSVRSSAAPMCYSLTHRDQVQMGQDALKCL